MSTLSHRKSALVTRKQLEAMPLPLSLGAQHNPVPHHLLVETLRVEIQERGYDIQREQYALGMQGSALFGVIDLMPPGVVDVTERGLSLGFRNSTNATLAIKVVAGTRVFVCDNLALSGDLIAVLKRNTKGLDIGQALTAGFDTFLRHATSLDLQIARLRATLITDLDAKARVFDVFAAKIVPVHLFDDVNDAYFGQVGEDCAPRTAWGLHNAFTRSLKTLGPTSAFNVNVALGRAFGMVS